MNIEKLERVAIDVKNLDHAVDLFSSLFNIKFERLNAGTVRIEETEKGDPPLRKKLELAMSPLGIELIESDPPAQVEGIRSFHLKVPNLAEAEAEMNRKGIGQLSHAEVGSLKEAIFDPEDLCGIRLVLVEYEAANALEAAKS